MNKAHLIVFCATPPTPRQSRLVQLLRNNGLEPLVDSVHKDKIWFQEQFGDLVHKMYYTDPILLHGVISEIDFNIMSYPELAIYFVQGSKPLDFEEWEEITMYLESLINGATVDSEISNRVHERLASRTFIETDTFHDLTIEDDLVVLVDARDYYYGYEYKLIQELDILLCQVTKPRSDDPYLVVVRAYSKDGITSLFSDLFIDDSWGRCEADIKFLTRLWKEFQVGEFDIDKLLKTATEKCYPDNGAYREPVVYRMDITQFCETDSYKNLFIKSDGLLESLTEKLGGSKI